MVVLSTHLGVNNVGTVFGARVFMLTGMSVEKALGGGDVTVAFQNLKGPTGKLGKDFCKGM